MVLISTREYLEHLAVQVKHAIVCRHQALEAFHTLLGAQELGSVFEVKAQRLGGQPQVFQQDGCGVCTERLAAQAYIQQPVFGRLGLLLCAVQQPALLQVALYVYLDLQRRRGIQPHQLHALRWQAVHNGCELRINVVPEHYGVVFKQGRKAF